MSDKREKEIKELQKKVVAQNTNTTTAHNQAKGHDEVNESHKKWRVLKEELDKK